MKGRVGERASGRKIFLALLFVVAPIRPFAPSPAQAQPSPALSQDDILREFLWDRFQQLPPGEKPKMALVLSGGGARAMSHVGVLEALERQGFDFDIVAGTSMGSMVGALYASGLKASEIRKLAPKMDLAQRKILKPASMFGLMFRGTLIASDPIQDFVVKTLGDKRFDQLKRPFGCVATDLRTGEKIIFREGDVAPAVRSSMNLPGLLAPMEYRHRLLVDGGVVDYVPVDVAKLLGADWTLSSLTEGQITREEIDNVFTTLQQVIDIRGSLLAHDLLKQSDIVVKPAAGHIGTFDFDKMDEAMNLGVIAGQVAAPKAQEDLAYKTLPFILDEWKGGNGRNGRNGGNHE